MGTERINGLAIPAGEFPPQYSPATASAFGTPESEELTPVVQGDFVYGLNMQIWKTAVTSGTGASVDTNDGRLRIQSGTDAAGYAYQESLRPIKYRAGQGSRVRFTPVFTTGVADSMQLLGAGAIISNAPYDGYFFGYDGATFGIVHYARGAVVGSFVPQADWNGTPCDWYDPTKGTPVTILYPYLGYGNIFFLIQNPNTGFFELVHTIRYANTTTATQMSNPSVYICGYTANSGNETNLTMYVGSVGAFISGKRSFVGDPDWSAKSSKDSITTETALLTIKNATTYNGIANRGLIRLTNISYAASANAGSASFDFVVNATLGGTPSYAAINGTTADGGATITSGNSVTSFDVAGTTVADGMRPFSISVDNPNSGILDLDKYDLIVGPGQTMTITGTSTNASTMAVSLNWSEDI